jgi:hypothetical protein
LALVAVVAVVALDCDDWHTMDDVFTRSSVGTTGVRGWTGGDGAVGIQLPGAADRTLWIFGDSAVTALAADGTRVYPNGSPLGNTVFGNTIAIQDSSTSPTPSAIEFYAREQFPGHVRYRSPAPPNHRLRHGPGLHRRDVHDARALRRLLEPTAQPSLHCQG